MTGKSVLLALLSALCLSSPALAARVLTLDDMMRENYVSDPQIAPRGDAVAYTVDTMDLKTDKNVSHIWLSRWDGSGSVQLTSRPKESETTPRFSPDGRYLAFLSDRGEGDDEDQVWLLDRAGGEAQKLTDFKGGVKDLVWSPDGKTLALIVEDAKPDADTSDDKDKPQKPVVIDRFYFMEDVTGYLGPERRHLYLFDVASRKASRVVAGNYEELLPAWSPDGKSIAFVSKRSRPDFDRDNNWDVYVVAAKAGASPRALTSFPGTDNDPDWSGDPGAPSYPAWSPDGKYVAYLQGGPLKLIEYAVHHLAVAPVAGGAPRVLTAGLDRNVSNPIWSSDGKSIRFLVEDDRTMYLARVAASGGAVEHLAGARNVIIAHSAVGGKEALLIGSPSQSGEIFAWDGGAPRQISHQNDWMKAVKFATVKEIGFASKDGTDVHGFLFLPPDYQPGRKYPTLLQIHGGPVSQLDNTYDFDPQLFAGHGYVVVESNPRGSSGRGEAYAKAIYADWGNKDAQDVLAGVDYAVAKGYADPARLGVGGWSYGGMLTNYVIAQDTRFKAATSGASIANILAGYGTDEYVRDYEAELGAPWANTATWLRISFPFLHADRIKTPTMFLGGTADMNVPLHNGEQMYQALRSLGVETKLIIYPGQFHGLTQPSDLHDRMERYIAWFDAHLKRK